MRKPAMLQKLLITTAASCVIISGALAQSAQPQTETAPVVKEQTVPEAKQALGSVSSDRFIKEQGADQWVFTKFKGTHVLGPDNARVGGVDDLLFDKNGKIIGMVVEGQPFGENGVVTTFETFDESRSQRNAPLFVM
jgi:hypothetical protein